MRGGTAGFSGFPGLAVAGAGRAEGEEGRSGASCGSAVNLEDRRSGAGPEVACPYLRTCHGLYIITKARKDESTKQTGPAAGPIAGRKPKPWGILLRFVRSSFRDR